MSKSDSARFFYQEGAVCTRWEVGRSRSLIKAAGVPVAEQAIGGSAQGSMMLASNDTGSVLAESFKGGDRSAGYSPYGFQRGLESLMGFAGQMRSLLPLGYFLGGGYRFFSIALMRFYSSDNLSPFGMGGINTYAYCGGDPMNRIDPSGHMYNQNTKRFYSFQAEGRWPPIYSVELIGQGKHFVHRGSGGTNEIVSHASPKRAGSPVSHGDPKRALQGIGPSEGRQFAPVVERGAGGSSNRTLMSDTAAEWVRESIETSTNRVFVDQKNGESNRAVAQWYLAFRKGFSKSDARRILGESYPINNDLSAIRRFVNQSLTAYIASESAKQAGGTRYSE